MKDYRLFQGIGEKEMKDLLQCLDAREQVYEKNEFVLSAGMSTAFTGIVTDGALKIIQEDYWGNRTIIGMIQEGDIFGEAFSCAGINPVPVSVVASRKTKILLLEWKKLVTVCSHACPFHSRVTINMMQILAEKNIALMQKMEHITKRSTREKLLSFLSSQALEQGSSSFDIPFSRQELADYLSVDRSAMSAELGRMQNDGLIRFRKNHFFLIKEEL